MVYSRSVAALADCLLEGDVQKSWLLIAIYIEEGHSSTDVYTLLTEAMYEVGKRWQENKISVADEHLATAACDYVLTRFQLSQHQLLQRNRALLFCIEGEEHYLGIKMIAGLMSEHGWEVKNLGANLPLPFALKSIERWDPDVVCLSVSQVHLLPDLQKYIAEIESMSQSPLVLVGSRLLSTHDLSASGSSKTIFINHIQAFKDWLLINNKESSTQDKMLVMGEEI
ncbi:cobalamin B12-binding domain-containing protein [Priestia aryabhattai]|uniref:Cobalamin-dependent protein n=1 Tax=Priestia aryabhattai TaxID=412384 RepID=A0ABD5KT32_PRIAR